MNIGTKIIQALLIVAFAVAGTQAKADSAAELKALMAVDQTWQKAYASRDADALASLYDEDAILLPPGAPAAKGRAAIRAFFAADVAAAEKEGISFVLGPNPQGGTSGDFGWASGTYVAKDKSGKVVERGKYLSVSRKKDGKWLYVRDMWNADGAAAPAAAPPKK
jgi:ketosteroid isomerase-like protein